LGRRLSAAARHAENEEHNMVHERQFFSHGSDRWVLRRERQPIGLSVVRYVEATGYAIPFEEYYATGTGPEHKAFVKLVESLVPRTAEFRVG
jgi:hypothetical protein